nr:hypothetical protein Hi04_10k_c2476_00017 [uncultured bacterium]
MSLGSLMPSRRSNDVNMVNIMNIAERMWYNWENNLSRADDERFGRAKSSELLHHQRVGWWAR